MIPKFRAWHKLGKKMYRVSQLRFNADDTLDEIQLYGDCNQVAEYVPQELTIMPSIGMIDKNGNPIFEGDIVAFTDGDGVGRMVVEWMPDLCQFQFHYCYSPNDYFTRDEFCAEDNLWVDGNIYENPELLKD